MSLPLRDPAWLERRSAWDQDPELLTRVAALITDVRARGDAALREQAERFDQVAPETLRLDPVPDWRPYVAPDVVVALHTAHDRLLAFHQKQPLISWTTETLGGILGQRVTPLARVGCYVPGGTAPLISTVLHTVVPARAAGVREIVIVTPPNPDFPQTGYVHPAILAAAEIAGAREVWRIGGAGAIAALAYGTATLRRVDKLAGPGSIWVTVAKKLVFGDVGVDGLPGPTETIVIADADAKPEWVAADLLAQAEHDVLASAILLTPSAALAHAVQAAVDELITSLPRADIITQTFSRGSGIVVVRDLDEACVLADRYAPEHLCLAVRDPWAWAPKIQHAGGLFLGEHSFEVLGDYIAGPSHVMPTGGTARFMSPLSAVDFVRITSIVALDPGTTADIAPQAALLAEAEGLGGHALSARCRG